MTASVFKIIAWLIGMAFSVLSDLTHGVMRCLSLAADVLLAPMLWVKSALGSHPEIPWVWIWIFAAFAFCALSAVFVFRERR